MSNVLLTGINGFIGSNLSVYLTERGCQVESMTLRGRENVSIGNNIDIVVHLAGKAHDVKGGSELAEYMKVNTELTCRMFDAFLESGASVFIFMSSVKAVADRVEEKLDENANPEPMTAYGISKRKAEEYILAKLPAGKRVFILRPCMVHGPGNKGNLNLLYKFMKYGVPYPLAAFNNRRSFLSVENLCFVIYEISKRNDIPGGVYNVADPDPLAMNDLIQLIAENAGKPLRRLRIGKKVVTALARFGDIFRLPFNTSRLQKLTENYIVDSSKVLGAIGRELPLSVKEGLLITLRSFH